MRRRTAILGLYCAVATGCFLTGYLLVLVGRGDLGLPLGVRDQQRLALFDQLGRVAVGRLRRAPVELAPRFRSAHQAIGGQALFLDIPHLDLEHVGRHQALHVLQDSPDRVGHPHLICHSLAQIGKDLDC